MRHGYANKCELPLSTMTLQDQIPQLTEAQIEAIAERAAEVAIERVYTQIGKSVVNKVLWLVGAGSVALLAWLAGNNKL